MASTVRVAAAMAMCLAAILIGAWAASLIATASLTSPKARPTAEEAPFDDAVRSRETKIAITLLVVGALAFVAGYGLRDAISKRAERRKSSRTGTRLDHSGG